MKIQLKLMRSPVYPGICIDISTAFSFGEQCKIITSKDLCSDRFQFYSLFFRNAIFLPLVSLPMLEAKEKSLIESPNNVVSVFTLLLPSSCYSHRFALCSSFIVRLSFKFLSYICTICIWNPLTFCPFIPHSKQIFFHNIST